MCVFVVLHSYTEVDMSKGNPIIPVRVEPLMLALVEEAITAANERRREAEYTVSEWIRQAIREKLAHLRRSKNRPKKWGV